jgi:hypothetical protein
MVVLRGYSSLFFNKNEITAFFKTLNALKTIKSITTPRRRNKLLSTLLGSIRRILKDYQSTRVLVLARTLFKRSYFENTNILT